jgi:hypothetical protein
LEFLYGNGSSANLGTVTKTGNTVSYEAPYIAEGTYIVVRFQYWISDGKGGTSTNLHAIVIGSNP